MRGAGDFWSRRKAQVEAEAQAERAALEAEAQAVEQAEAETRPDDEILAELGLPDPDAMQPGDDFSGFMAKAVPDRLRLRALRKLWLTNPVLANVDGLVDYGEDFTDAACVIENMQTAYQVGKGMTKHVEEMARQELEAEADADAMDDVVSLDEVEESEDDAEDAIEVAAAETAPVTDETAAPSVMSDDTDAPPAPRRRMRFHFEDQRERLEA